jgi:hypothetical protein
VLLKSLAVASAGTPSIGAILLILLLLSSANGLKKASAFFFAYAFTYSVIGTVTVVVGEQMQNAGAEEAPSNAGSWAALGAGCLLLFFAFRTWRKPAGEHKKPRIFEKIDQISATKLFAFGLFVPCVNFKNLALFLSAVSIVAGAALPIEHAFAMVLAVVFVFCAGVMTPIVLFALGRKRAEPLLARFRDFLERNNRVVTMSVMTLFGSGFLIRAAYGLLG